MKQVMVLGGSGMLGSMIVDVLTQGQNVHVTGTVRKTALPWTKRYPKAEWRAFDIETLDPGIFEGHHWIINAIGITKPLIKDDNPEQIERAIEVNSLFPHRLAAAALKTGSRVIQIATDCVYSGTRGRYVESDLHDAVDVYGKSKSLGETYHPNVHHLRCSIIGPEPKEFKFFIEWFRRQPRGAQVNGFRNHFWNGITTLHFARLCGAIITNDLTLGHLQHMIPAGYVTKAEMLRHFARIYNRSDIEIADIDASVSIDRTLGTVNEERNDQLWAAASYATPPSIPQMLDELAAFDYRGNREMVR